MAASSLEIDLFGRPEVRFAAKRVETNAPAKTWALLALILLQPGRRFARDVAADVLWPDEAQVNALANLRRHLYRLTRNLLPPAQTPWLSVTSRTIAWQSAASLTLDVDLFESLVADSVTVERGLALYRGDLLESFDEPWLEPHRARWRDRFHEAGHRALARAAANRPQAALAIANRLLTHDPLDEVALRMILQMQAERGERFTALRAYDQFRRTASEELGVEPDAQTQALHDRIVAGLDATLSASERDRRLTGLPLATTTFFGRDAEREALGELLMKRPLLTLLGIGGIGKTRLALDLAASAIDLFAGGATFIDAGRIDGEDRLVAEIARKLGVRRSADATKALSDIAAAFAQRRRIVILDNCEVQRDTVAAVVEHLLPVLGESRLIVASRERLDIEGELVHRVQPLDTASAARLFIDRVHAAETSTPPYAFATGALDELVSRLDGIPLALELAATRAARSGAAELTASLADAIGLAPYARGRPSRRKTMGAVLDWSHGWLDENARQVFRRLSVFVGGWTAAMACEACGDGDDEAVHAALDALVDGSLATIDRAGVETRYRFLEPIRAYAARRLRDAAEFDSASNRHAQSIAHIGEAFTDARRLLPMPERIARSAADVDNLRAALVWTLRLGNDVPLGRRIAAASMFFLFVAPDEGRAWVREALATVDRDTDRVVEAKLQFALARHAVESLRYAEGHAASLRALELARTIGDQHLVQSILLRAVFAAVGARRLDEAEAFAIECIALARALGNEAHERQAQQHLPVVVMQRGEYDRARTLFLEQLELDGTGSFGAPIDNRLNFAENEFLAGRTSEAVRLGAETIARCETPNDYPGRPYAFVNQALYLFAAERLSDARTMALRAIEAAREARLEGLVYLAMQTLAALAEANGRAAVAARLLAFVDARLAGEGFLRDGAPARQASALAERLRSSFNAEDLNQAAVAVQGWDESTALREAADALAGIDTPAVLDEIHTPAVFRAL